MGIIKKLGYSTKRATLIGILRKLPDETWIDEGFLTYIANDYVKAIYPESNNTQGAFFKVLHNPLDYKTEVYDEYQAERAEKQKALEVEHQRQAKKEKDQQAEAEKHAQIERERAEAPIDIRGEFDKVIQKVKERNKQRLNE